MKRGIMRWLLGTTLFVIAAYDMIVIGTEWKFNYPMSSWSIVEMLFSLFLAHVNLRASYELRYAKKEETYEQWLDRMIDRPLPKRW